MRQQSVPWSQARDRQPFDRSLATEWARALGASWQRVALGAILVLAAFLNLFALDREGYANTYYAAAIKSMLTSWSNFFFVSFDPGGFVSVDKPPLGFWIQAIFAKVLGFSGISILLPQSLAGVLSVALLYLLVRRIFAEAAGLLAALVLAATPIAVAVNRNNTIDALLILVLLSAVWAVTQAIERGGLRWLVLCAILVGLGFNIKMMQAFLVVPALGLAYLLGSRVTWRARIGHLAVAAVVLAVVSLSWSVVVELTPASQRPYVGSSSGNSALDLAIGYNGLLRLLPAGWMPSSLSTPIGGPPSSGANIAPRGMPSDGPNALRLFNQSMAGQIAWLLPLAVVGGVAAWRQARLHLPLNRRHTALVIWGTWLATGVGFFSVAPSFSVMHLYYLAMLAPPIAALVGIGLMALWRDYRRPAHAGTLRARLQGWLLPLAIAGTAGVAAWILRDYPEQNRWLTPIVTVAGLGAAGMLVWLRWQAAEDRPRSRLLPAVVMVALVAILITPTVWAGYTVWEVGGNSSLPTGGPESGFGPFGWPGAGAGTADADTRPEFTFTDLGWERADAKLLSYLEHHQQGEKYLFATSSAMGASPYILATGKPVAALGGFIGSDPILTTEQLAAMVERGEVRYFLVSSPAQQEAMAEQFAEMLGWPGGASAGASDQPSAPALPAVGPMGGQSANTAWIHAHCTPVPVSEWQSPDASAGGMRGMRMMSSLYDCAAAGQAAQ